MGLDKPYSFGSYNEVRGDKQQIRVTEGCPNQCPYCYEPAEIKIFDIPEIVRNKVRISDMNLLCKPEAMEIIKELGEKRVDGKVVYYELICGIDWRYLLKKPRYAEALKKSRFVNIRLAWDLGFNLQKKIKKAIQILVKAGYESKKISVFILCNWKISYEVNCLKMDLCKVWRVKINDCWFDNQVSPNIKPVYWTKEQIIDFRGKVRMHNKLVSFGIDPEYRIPASQELLIKEVTK